MAHWRRAIALAIAAGVVFPAALGAQKLSDVQKKEIGQVTKLADDLTMGTGQAPNELGLAWLHEDFIKAQGNKTFVPFTVTVDPSKVPGGKVTFYWRVASTSAPAAGAKPAAEKTASKFAWEDAGYDVPVTAATPGGVPPGRISRSFSVPAGTYDVYLVAKVPDSSQKGAPRPAVSAMKHTVTVPDFWNGELTTSSIIMAQRMDPLPAPLTPQQLTERPYALGTLELQPQFEMTFSKTADLNPVFFVYNPKLDAANKPDVVIEYNFHTRSGGAEKLFNHTAPQSYNAETMPEFNAAAGHQIPGGISVSLGNFPAADYRMEIKITDKIANASITRNLNFTVSGP